MGSVSNSVENAWLDKVFRGTALPFDTDELYVGLSTADPTDAGSGIAEPSGNGYTRSANVFNAFTAASSRATQNSGTITFPTASGSWGTISHWFICDDVSNVNWGTDVYLIAHGQLAVSKAVVSGNTPSIAAGQIVISVGASAAAGGMFNYLVHKLLDLTFKGTAYTSPTIHMALCTDSTIPVDAATTFTEVSGNNYSRKEFSGTSHWAAASGGATSNSDAATFATPSGSWGTVYSVMLVDAASSGNLLFKLDIETQTPTTDDVVQYAAGDCDIAIT